VASSISRPNSDSNTPSAPGRSAGIGAVTGQTAKLSSSAPTMNMKPPEAMNT
jgi:hypothetical protein